MSTLKTLPLALFRPSFQLKIARKATKAFVAVCPLGAATNSRHEPMRGTNLTRHKPSRLLLATALTLSLLFAGPTSAQVTNLSFETGDLTGWVGNAQNSVEVPLFFAQEGDFAAKTITGGWGVSQLFQFFYAPEGQTFEGQTFYLSGYMFSEAGLPEGISVGLLKILFLNESNELLQPTYSCKGDINPDFPGAAALPLLVSSSPANTWIFAEAQAVAPPGTIRVGIELTNVNFTGTESPIWFDDVTLQSDPIPRLGTNCGFETGDFSGWVPNVFEPWGGDFSVGAPLAGAQEGNYAAEVTNTNGIGVAQLRQYFPARPGDEFYMSVHMLTETGLVDGISWGVPKLVFFNRESATPWVALPPRSVSKGFADIEFPGLVAPLLDNNSPPNTWVFSELQGVAPPGTTEVMIELNNVNFTGAESPIWFDDARLQLVRTDTDVDGLVDSVDTDPLSPSFDFSNGLSSGTISDPGNQVLWIFDEPATDGIRILADTSGGAGIARLSVCESSATLSIKAGNDLVVTCGSVILQVEAGPAVAMEIDLNGEVAIVTVPPEVIVTFEPEESSLAVASTSTDPEPVVLTVGGTQIPLEPGKTFSLVPFDSFSAIVEIRNEIYGIEGAFTLGSESNGIDLPAESLALSVGASIINIPAGFLSDDGNGEYKFEGNLDDMAVKVEIKAIGANEFSVEIDVASVLNSISNPIEVGLTIGDDRGTTIAVVD